ncbi:HET-domain-containing protein, partial [Cadophora sp. DSE1049]
MDSGDSYQYPPLLPRACDAIRLLILQPAHDIDATVECNLINTTLSECADDVVDHYSALSYVWGDAKDTRMISLHGKPVHVTVNLDSALRHMRDTTRTRKIWADAICINQADVTEKNKQVRLMGDVYQSARHTIIYLGEATVNTDFLLSFVRQDLPGYQSKFTASTTSDADREKLLDWSSIFSRPWFTRVWVYQELVFSADPWLQCGSIRARWNQVRCTLESICDSLDIHMKDTNVFHSMDKGRVAFRKRDEELDMPDTDVAASLLDILDTRRGMGVSDPRDMLFAHRTVITNWTRWISCLLDVDYNKTRGDVFNDTARYLLENAKMSQHLDMLSYIENSFPRTGDFASWVPDWT